MSIASRLKADALLVVEAGGLHWRLRRVLAGDLVALGDQELLAVLPTIVGAADGASEATLLARAVEALASRPELLQARLARPARLLCASVVAASEDGGVTWEPVTVIEGDAPGPAEVRVADLLPAVRSQLTAAAQAHSLGSVSLPAGSFGRAG